MAGLFGLGFPEGGDQQAECFDQDLVDEIESRHRNTQTEAQELKRFRSLPFLRPVEER